MKGKADELPRFNPDMFQVDAGLSKKLAVKTPAQFVLKRPGSVYDYVEVGYMRRRLEAAFGLSWSFETDNITPMETLATLRHIVVKGRLTIRHPITGEVMIIRENYGGSEIKFHSRCDGGQKAPDYARPLDIGNDFKAAAADALKKCASSLGIAADIYEQKVNRKLNETATTPVETTELAIEGAVTTAQRQLLFAKAAAAGIDEAGLRGILREVTGKESTSELMIADLTKVLDRIQKEMKR